MCTSEEMSMTILSFYIRLIQLQWVITLMMFDNEGNNSSMEEEEIRNRGSYTSGHLI